MSDQKKYPYYARYVNDLQSSSFYRSLSLEEVGAYNILMDGSWEAQNQCFITDMEVEELRVAHRITKRKWEKLFQKMKTRFQFSESNKGWYSPRLVKELDKLKRKSSINTENGGKGGRRKNRPLTDREADAKPEERHSESDLESEPDPDKDQESVCDMGEHLKSHPKNLASHQANQLETLNSDDKADDAAFLALREVYPKKSGDPDAQRMSFNQALRTGSTTKDLSDALNHWVKVWKAKGTELQYIPSMENWFRKRYFNEVPKSQPEKKQKQVTKNVTCDHCSGSGKLVKLERVKVDSGEVQSMTNLLAGMSNVGSKKCEKCRGTGKVQVTKTVNA